MKIPNAQKARQQSGDAPVPPGSYLMKIKACREKNGRLLLLWEAINGEHEGGIVWDGYSMDNPKACGILIRRLETLGVEVDENGFFDEESAEGKIAEVVLVQNGTFVNVKSIAAVDDATIKAVKAAAVTETDEDAEVPF